MNKTKKFLFGLSVAAVATAGIVIPQTAAPQSASAMNVCKVWYTTEYAQNPNCWPASACSWQVKHVSCTRY